MKILIIGESCKDIFYYGDASRLCPEAPVPVFKAINKVENGGMAKNVQNNLEVFGVVTNIITNENWQDITKTRFVDHRTNHMFLRVDEADDLYGTLNSEELKKIDFSSYDAIIVSDYNKGFLPVSLLAEIPKFHNLVFLDTKKLLGDWSENYAFIKINNKEFDLTKHTLTTKLANKVIITRGPNGCEYRDHIYAVPPVEVKDTSGAGDTFIAAFACSYMKTSNIPESIVFANHCATKVVQKRGVSTCE